MPEMTKEQIVRETVAFFENNPRSLRHDGFCLYNGPNGEGCAFTRVVQKRYRKRLIEGNACHVQPIGERHLYKRYRGHGQVAAVSPTPPTTFWTQVQAIHDNDRFWVDGQFTQKGREYVRGIFGVDLDADA